MKRFPWVLLLAALTSLWPAVAGEPTAASAGSNLPVIALEAAEPIASDRKAPCNVRLILPNGVAPGQPMSGVIRYHGASSQAYPKKSFGLTLDAPASLLGMTESSHWVLNAAFIDRSLMRHKLSYDLFRSLSTTNAPRVAAASRFVDVRLAGKYQGTYLLMQRVDRALFGFKAYDSNTVEHACLYKAVDHAATFYHGGHWGFEQREPDPLKGEYWGPLDQLNQFVSRTPDAPFFAPTGIASRVDLANALDFHLLILLTSNMDGYDKNLILARDAPQTNSPAPRFVFAPWDYDATFGRNWEGSRVGTTAWLSNHLFDRLLQDPAYRSRFAARWAELRRAQFSVPTIHHLIDENVKTLGAAAARNAARWQAADGYYPDQLTFSQDIAEMKDWVVRRTRWLDDQIRRRTRE